METTGTAKGPNGSAKRVSRVIRGALIVAAVAVAAGAVWWFSVLGDVRRAVALYDSGQTSDAANALRRVIASPISAFRLREAAQHALGLCLSAEASRLATREPTRQGYEKALGILKEARALAGPTPDIESQVREYSAALSRLEGKGPLPPTRYQVFGPPETSGAKPETATPGPADGQPSERAR